MQVIHILSRGPNGVEDGWWMGELEGRTGLFPSIVVEECQANGDDWSPDVSLASPTSVGPPCFTPPGLAGPPPSLPPAPPLPSAAPSSQPESQMAAGEAEESAASSVAASLNAPETSIIITNPTPIIEEASSERDPEPVSYHVENPNFSMDISSEKKNMYNNAATAAGAIAVEAVATSEEGSTAKEDSTAADAAPGSSLTFTDITITAPTPSTQSPVEEEKNVAEPNEVAAENPNVGQPEKEEGGQKIESQPSAIISSNAEENEASFASGGWANFQVSYPADDFFLVK